MKVNIGANSYASVDQDGVMTDFRLSAGRSASTSLREYAASLRQQVKSDVDRAELADQAADMLEQ